MPAACERGPDHNFQYLPCIDGRWNPWDTLRERPHIELWYAALDGLGGMWQRDREGELIVLDDSLTRRQRRCVLAHELIHAERGIGHGAATAATMEREEEIVRRETARRLVPLAELVEFAAPREGIEPVTLEDVIAEFDVEADVAMKALELLVITNVATAESRSPEYYGSVGGLEGRPPIGSDPCPASSARRSP
jgi:hypothetical protein